MWSGRFDCDFQLGSWSGCLVLQIGTPGGGGSVPAGPSRGREHMVGGGLSELSGRERESISSASRWYAVHTLPQREIGAAGQLSRQGFEPFLLELLGAQRPRFVALHKDYYGMEASV